MDRPPSPETRQSTTKRLTANTKSNKADTCILTLHRLVRERIQVVASTIYYFAGVSQSFAKVSPRFCQVSPDFTLISNPKPRKYSEHGRGFCECVWRKVTSGNDHRLPNDGSALTQLFVDGPAGRWSRWHVGRRPRSAHGGPLRSRRATADSECLAATGSNPDVLQYGP